MTQEQLPAPGSESQGAPSVSFSELGLPEAAVKALQKRGITEAFPIQQLALPPAMEGRDVCGKAPTGSGKTLAFGLPLAQRVTKARPKRPRGLILTPTRELAAQIETELGLLLAPRKRSVASFYGGVSFGPQLRGLRQGVDVAVACPGRLLDLVGKGAMSLKDVDFVVIDEADRMADMGFLPDVREILDQVKPDRQTLLFSATLDGDIGVLVQNYQDDPVECEVPSDDSHMERITHEFIRLKHSERMAKAIEIVNRYGSTVVFCRTKRGVDRVCDEFKKEGIRAVPIHGGRSQAQRDRALASFTKRRAEVLVATDVAARGIHVNDVQCVLHYDIAGDHKDYVHRSGRTGRAGADGVVISFVTDSDVGKARYLRRELNLPGHSGADRGPSHDHPRPKRAGGRRSRPRGRWAEGQPGEGGRSRDAGRGQDSGREQDTGQVDRQRDGRGSNRSGTKSHSARGAGRDQRGEGRAAEGQLAEGRPSRSQRGQGQRGQGQGGQGQSRQSQRGQGQSGQGQGTDDRQQQGQDRRRGTAPGKRKGSGGRRKTSNGRRPAQSHKGRGSARPKRSHSGR